MTEPFRLTEGDDEDTFELLNRPERPERPKADAWIDRVRQADAEAEEAWRRTLEYQDGSVLFPSTLQAYALAAIASELRAQRIARRPGAGQK